MGNQKENIQSVYFVENFSPRLKEINSKIVALNSQVCHELGKENISYQIYEDYYDMFERKFYTQGYNQRKDAWIVTFDNYLRGKLRDSLDKKINFVKLYGYYIEGMVDSFIISVKNILSVLDREKPQKVYFVSTSDFQTKFDWKLFTAKGDLTAYLLPVICKELGVMCSSISVVPAKMNSDSSLFKLKSLPLRVLKTLRRIIEGLYIRAEYLLLFPKRRKLRKEGKFKRFIITYEDWLGDFYKKAIRAGHEVLYHTMNGPRKFLFLRKRNENEISDFPVSKEALDFWANLGNECVKEFNPSQWAVSEAGVDIGSVLTPRFLYFLQKVCPILSDSVKKYEKIFKEKKIDYVICQYKMFPTDFAIMAVATVLNQVLSVHVEHGGGEMDYYMQYFTELPANIYVPSSKEEAGFYRRHFNLGNKEKVTVVEARAWISKYRLEGKRIAEKFSKLSVNDKSDSRRQKVCYIPAALRLQRFSSSYPLCWYHLLQRKLCEHFKELSRYDFIVKFPYILRKFFLPLSDFLDDLKTSNIFFRGDDLVVNLRQADRVITDFPSTPTYEARLMGLPVLSLYHDSVNVRHTAKQIYGKTLVSFKTTQEALRHIDKFLSSDPKEYIVSTEDNFSSPTMLEVLEQYKYDEWIQSNPE